uniref:Uncharacterized protein n=1 Tax=Ditylenchus dipsaci TaxID=166011 RepID=A0A915DJ66_9BILA
MELQVPKMHISATLCCTSSTSTKMQQRPSNPSTTSKERALWVRELRESGSKTSKMEASVWRMQIVVDVLLSSMKPN